MITSRRTLVRSLGAGLLGAGALAACTPVRGGRGSRTTTPAPTAAAAGEPEEPLILGSIGASYGRSGAWESTVSIGISEAVIDVNAAYDGLFGQDVQLTSRHTMAEAGEDLAPVIADLADQGVTALITSIDEDALVGAMPAIVEAGMAVIDVTTSGMSVRDESVSSSGLLARLSPSTRVLAARYAETAFAASGTTGAPGTVGVVTEDTSQGDSLIAELKRVLNPASGQVTVAQKYPFGDIGDVDALVQAVLADPPSLLVVNGGSEVGPFLSALYAATLDEEGGRPEVKIPVQLSPAATVDYSAAKLVPESLNDVTGYQVGGALSTEHINMMLNIDPDLQHTTYPYSQSAYEAVVLAALAAYDALSVAGTDIAGSIPRVLTGDEACTDYGTCRDTMRAAVQQDTRAQVALTGRMGQLEIGGVGDPLRGELRSYSYADDGAIQGGDAETYEAPE